MRERSLRKIRMDQYSLIAVVSVAEYVVVVQRLLPRRKVLDASATELEEQ